MVVYTGSETKLAMNSRHAPAKLSKMDRLVNRAIYMIIIFEIIIVIVCASVSSAVNTKTFNSNWYLTTGNLLVPPAQNTSFHYNWVQNFFTFLTIYSNFVPLSLYVTLELVIFALQAFIEWDTDMYHEETNTPAVSRSSQVADLGQVQYVFSDKTGTLTANVMDFRRASVGGDMYGEAVMEKEGIIAERPPYKIEAIRDVEGFEAEFFKVRKRRFGTSSSLVAASVALITDRTTKKSGSAPLYSCRMRAQETDTPVNRLPVFKAHHGSLPHSGS